MKAVFKLGVSLVETVDNAADDRARLTWASEICKRFDALHNVFGFGQMPFDRCIVCEGEEDVITSGNEVETTDVPRRMCVWVEDILSVARGVLITDHRTTGSITFVFGNRNLKYGFYLNASIDGCGQNYTFRVVPRSEDSFNLDVCPIVDEIEMSSINPRSAN